MKEIVTEIEWPDGIPLPREEYSGAPNESLLVSSLESARIQRRLRFSGAGATLSLHWTLSISEYESFLLFFETTLQMGAAMFRMPLRYPRNSALTDWLVRFLGGFSKEWDEPKWQIDASVRLIKPIRLASAAQPSPSPFLVQSPEDNPMIVVVDQPFYVRQPVESDFIGFLTSGGESFLESSGRQLQVLDL